MTDITGNIEARLRIIESQLRAALTTDLTWAQKHWGWMIAGALIVGFVAGKF